MKAQHLHLQLLLRLLLLVVDNARFRFVIRHAYSWQVHKIAQEAVLITYNIEIDGLRIMRWA